MGQLKILRQAYAPASQTNLQTHNKAIESMMTSTTQRLAQMRFAVIALLLFVLPITMGTVSGVAGVIYVLLFVLALTQPLANWKPTEKYEWILIVLIIAAIAAVLLSFINADNMRMSVARFERVVRMLGFIPIYFLLKASHKSLLPYFLSGVVLAGPVMLGVALYAESGTGAAEGAYNAILFGDYASFLAIACLPVIFLSSGNKWIKVAAVASFVCATQAAILSGTRGAYIALAPAVALIGMLWIISKSGSLRQRVMRLCALLVVCTLGIGLALQNPALKHRVDAAVSDIHNYITGEDPHTSVGLRFQMWEASVKMWQKNPIIGSGLGDFGVDLQRMMETGESQISHHFGEAHSLYFEFLATTGALGFILVTLSMFLFPAYVFLKNLSRGNSHALLVAASGLLFILSFMVFALSQNWLGRSSITSVYFTVLAVYLAEMHRSQKTVKELL